MLIIKCETCNTQFTVRGYTTPHSFDEPGEIVTELIPVNDDNNLCQCLTDGGNWELIEEESDEPYDSDHYFSDY